MFAGTYQCNLACPHCCVPIEWPERLSITAALSFLEDAHEFGIRTIGFTGGEPFLYLDFLEALVRRAAELGWRFDKIQTNGVWFQSNDELRLALRRLQCAGFTGKFGLSVDKFHHAPGNGGKPTLAALVSFCQAARQTFQRDNIVSLAYASRAPQVGLESIQRLASALGGVVEWSAVLRRYLVVTPDMTMTCNWNHLAPVERAEALGSSWDGEWFIEDYCEGPGQALVVTPKGEVKPCCGFASDLDQLTIGNIYTDRVADIVRHARQHPYVGRVFQEGLTAIKDEILSRDPTALPGATSNQCFLCWYVLTRGLVAGVSGGGGQVGAWTGERPNFRGERLQIGIRHGPAAGSPPSAPAPAATDPATVPSCQASDAE
jgi:hypothetical protein